MVGSVAVTTTVAITALGFFGIILAVIEGGSGTISNLLRLSSSAISGGQLWRLVTYPIPPDSDYFWALLGLLFFFLIGSQFESMLGRRAFTSLVVAIVVIPALLASLVAVATGQGVSSFGLSMIFLGIAAGFASAMPEAKSFFGIPFWAVVAFIFFVQLLSVLTSRSLPNLVMLLSTGAIGLIMTRSLGFSGVDWIPTVRLPAIVTGAGVTTASSAKPAKKSRRKKSKRASASHLQAVPTATTSEAEIDSLLDQVSERGIDSLTKQQKQTLERHSKEMRKRRDI